MINEGRSAAKLQVIRGIEVTRNCRFVSRFNQAGSKRLSKIRSGGGCDVSLKASEWYFFVDPDDGDNLERHP